MQRGIIARRTFWAASDTRRSRIASRHINIHLKKIETKPPTGEVRS